MKKYLFLLMLSWGYFVCAQSTMPDKELQRIADMKQWEYTMAQLRQHPDTYSAEIKELEAFITDLKSSSTDEALRKSQEKAKEVEQRYHLREVNNDLFIGHSNIGDALDDKMVKGQMAIQQAIQNGTIPADKGKEIMRMMEEQQTQMHIMAQQLKKEGTDIYDPNSQIQDFLKAEEKNIQRYEKMNDVPYMKNRLMELLQDEIQHTRDVYTLSVLESDIELQTIPYMKKRWEELSLKKKQGELEPWNFNDPKYAEIDQIQQRLNTLGEKAYLADIQKMRSAPILNPDLGFEHLKRLTKANSLLGCWTSKCIRNLYKEVPNPCFETVDCYVGVTHYCKSESFYSSGDGFSPLLYNDISSAYGELCTKYRSECACANVDSRSRIVVPDNVNISSLKNSAKNQTVESSSTALYERAKLEKEKHSMVETVSEEEESNSSVTSQGNQNPVNRLFEDSKILKGIADFLSEEKGQNSSSPVSGKSDNIPSVSGHNPRPSSVVVGQ